MSSSDTVSKSFCLGSLNSSVNPRPNTAATAYTINMPRIPIASSSEGKRSVDMAAPAFPPAAADIPCPPVVLYRVGYTSAGTTKVVVLGPKSMKKKVNT